MRRKERQKRIAHGLWLRVEARLLSRYLRLERIEDARIVRVLRREALRGESEKR